eukprot:362038-Chlamydomonas_euryale.AAC.2
MVFPLDRRSSPTHPPRAPQRARRKRARKRSARAASCKGLLSCAGWRPRVGHAAQGPLGSSLRSHPGVPRTPSQLAAAAAAAQFPSLGRPAADARRASAFAVPQLDPTMPPLGTSGRSR